MKRTLLLPFVMIALTQTAIGADNIANVYGRKTQTLNGKWHYIVDPYENGYFNYRYEPYDATEPATGGYFLDRKQTDRSELLEYDFDASPVLNVPGDWNSQDDKLFYYEGSVWYRRKFQFEKAPGHDRQFIHFGAVNYEAHVYLNGVKLGVHVGGFTPFQYEVTDVIVEGENSLVVMADNKRERDGVPTLNTDWWNYGGITRDVLLVEVPATYLADFSASLKSGDDGDYFHFEAQMEGKKMQQSMRFAVPELGVEAKASTDVNGKVEINVPAPAALSRWSPESPKLYEVTVQAETDATSDQVGFRTVETRGHDILINGEPVFLRGISIHEENPLRGGRAYSEEDARLLLGWAKELGCNFARLAHYPHNEHMARVADEMGIMLWEEIPVYWTISWENADTLANARRQLRDLILRDKNRASVIIWSVANETPISKPRTRFLKTLVSDARALDGTRLVSAAMEKHDDPDDADRRVVNDPFGKYTDLVSFNQYVGWYDGLPEKCDVVSFDIAYDKPVFISEFGAGALQGYHADALTRFSEEFQADLYARTVVMLERIDGFRGMTPWILVDFRSPRRPLPVVQDGWNRKGLIGDNGNRKQAFYILQEYYKKKAAEYEAAAQP